MHANGVNGQIYPAVPQSVAHKLLTEHERVSLMQNVVETKQYQSPATLWIVLVSGYILQISTWKTTKYNVSSKCQEMILHISFFIRS